MKTEDILIILRFNIILSEFIHIAPQLISILEFYWINKYTLKIFLDITTFEKYKFNAKLQ